jgi:hypothetical protein
LKRITLRVRCIWHMPYGQMAADGVDFEPAGHVSQRYKCCTSPSPQTPQPSIVLIDRRGDLEP